MNRPAPSGAGLFCVHAVPSLRHIEYEPGIESYSEVPVVVYGFFRTNTHSMHEGGNVRERSGSGGADTALRRSRGIH